MDIAGRIHFGDLFNTENQTRVNGGVKGESSRDDSPARGFLTYTGVIVDSFTGVGGSRFWDKCWTPFLESL